MKKNKKYKIIFQSLILLTGFFLSYNFSLASGCCVKDVGKSSESNCEYNAESSDCEGDSSSFIDGDLNCTKAKSGQFCGTSAASGTPTAAGASGGTTFINPLKFNTVEGLLGNILVAIQRIIGVLALVFIVIGAGFILLSAGSPDMVERGKKTIYMAFIGLAIGVAAPSMLKEIANAIGWGGTAETQAALSLSQIALRVLNFLLGIAGVLTVIMLVIGGMIYLTSAGDEDRIDSGKKIFKNSLIGIVIILASMVLVQQVARFFVN